MKFWQWVSITLVIVGLGLAVRPAPGMAAGFDRTASAFINDGDMWLMGDPDGGSTGYQRPNEGYRLVPDRATRPMSPRKQLSVQWLLIPYMRFFGH